MASIFELPSMLSIAEFGLKGLTSIAGYQSQQAEINRANAADQAQFWTQYSAQSQENYRAYEAQLNSWYREADYVEKRRQYELQLAEQQAAFKGAVTTAATKNFEKQLADLEGRFYEEEAKETVELENIRTQSFAAKAKVAASGQVGRTVQRMQQQYNQQYLSNVSNRQITRNFRIADKIRAAEAANIARENTGNQVQYYTPQPISDPVKPLAPLPIQAVAPTPRSGPSGTALAINLGSLAFDAYQNYKAMQPAAPKEVNARSYYSEAKIGNSPFVNPSFSISPPEDQINNTQGI
jgi:hypothetical protein